MNLFVYFAVCLQKSDCLPYALMEDSGFVANTEATSRSENGYRGVRKDGIRAMITIRLVNKRREVDGVNPRGIQTDKGVSFTPPSGLKIAFGCRFSIDRSLGFINFGTPYSDGTVELQPQAGADTQGFFKPSNHDWADDRKLLELITRETIALGLGTRLTAFAQGTIGGVAIPTARFAPSGQIFGDAKTWCKKKGWTWEENTDYGYFMLKKGDDYVVLPLGTGSMKVNGDWFDLPDVSARHDGTVYVPSEALVRLSKE